MDDVRKLAPVFDFLEKETGKASVEYKLKTDPNYFKFKNHEGTYLKIQLYLETYRMPYDPDEKGKEYSIIEPNKELPDSITANLAGDEFAFGFTKRITGKELLSAMDEFGASFKFGSNKALKAFIEEDPNMEIIYVQIVDINEDDDQSGAGDYFVPLTKQQLRDKAQELKGN